MKFIPRATHIIGRTMIMKSDKKIILTDETKQTKFVYVDAVGEAVKDVKVGDLLVPRVVGNIQLNNGVWCPFLEEQHVGFFVTDVNPDELLIQTANGQKYVPIESEDAARPLGASPKPEKETVQ